MSNHTQSETKRLFYGKYLYKFRISTPLAYLFQQNYASGSRFAEFDRTVSELASQFAALKKGRSSVGTIQIMRWRRSYDVTELELEQIIAIKNILIDNVSEYRSRVESKNICLFTNNENFIDQLKALAFADSDIEIWKPDPTLIATLLAEKDIYIVNKPTDYKYRVTVTGKPSNPKEVAKWLEDNADKVKASDAAIRGFHAEYWMTSLLFYIRDDKIMLLAQMMFGDRIKKIERLVYVKKESFV